MKLMLWTFLFCAACLLIYSNVDVRSNLRDIVPSESSPVSIQTLQSAKNFCLKQKLDTSFCLAIDMSKRSGSKRMHLVDLRKNAIVLSGLVAHGHCRNYASNQVSFSNEVGSNCTSEGHYRIGSKYIGAFGTSYKLHGLDATNSNAFNRFIVLHAHSCVPEETSAAGICRSEGCPTVSLNFLKKLETYLNQVKQPMMLWIYKS